MWELFIGCDNQQLDVTNCASVSTKMVNKARKAGLSRPGFGGLLLCFDRKLVLKAGGVVLEGHGCLPGSRCFRVALWKMKDVAIWELCRYIGSDLGYLDLFCFDFDLNMIV